MTSPKHPHSVHLGGGLIEQDFREGSALPDDRDPDYTPGPWEWRDVAGAGLGIYGDVSATMGKDFAQLVEIFGTGNDLYHKAIAAIDKATGEQA